MTPDEYAIHFCNNNDVPFATDSKKYRALVNVIKRAVTEEREACARLAETGAIKRCLNHERIRRGYCGKEIAAEIRARL